MTLTPEQQANREGKITASFAPYLMAGDEQKMLNEWRRIVGDPNYQPEDLSDNWPVQFGSYIETFAVDWHQRKTGQPLTMRGASVTHPERPYVAATLDCYRETDKTVIDCKAPGMFRKLDAVLAFYPAQLVVQKGCVRANNQALLVVHGGSEPVEHAIPLTDEYTGAVWERIQWFWHCVETLTPPAALAGVAAPVAPEKYRKVDMSGSNSWAEHAANWTANRDAAKTFETAVKEIKALIEPDVGEASGAGIIAKRSKAGAITIKEGKQ